MDIASDYQDRLFWTHGGTNKVHMVQAGESKVLTNAYIKSNF